MYIYNKFFPDNCEIITKNTLFCYLKRKEKNNLMKYKTSISYITMYDRLYKPFIKGFFDNKIIILKDWKNFIDNMEVKI